jgi:hypothetical protein
MSKIQLEKLRLDTLQQLDPRIEMLFQKHLQNIASDCIHRPGEKATRRLILEFFVEPDVDPDTGECDRVKIAVEGKSKVPVFRTKTFQMDASKDGFRFNSQVPENLDQPSLDFEEDEA